jgi:hypothetical protein
MRFHEPYFAHYTSDDLDLVFTEAGLGVQATWTSYLSKIIVCRKR